MSIARALPYLLLAVVLGAAGYLAGAVTDPFAPTQTRVAGELSPQEPQLRRQLEQARGEAADLTGELQRAQGTIDRLRADLAETRTRIAELQQRAETAEQARADAETRIAELAARVAALEARADTEDAQQAEASEPAETAAPSEDTGNDAITPEVATGDAAAEQPPQPDPTAAADGAPADNASQEAASEDTAPEETAPETGTTSQTADAADGTAPNTTAAPSPAQDTQPADGATAAAPATVPGVANAGPAGVDADPRPAADALSAINPSTRQANRLVAGVQAYQDADYQEAFRAWLPLARAGYARAQLHLGALFLEGRGTDRNDPLAYAWLTIARDNGSQNAGPLLEQLRQRMSAADLDAARRLLTRARQTAGNAG